MKNLYRALCAIALLLSVSGAHAQGTLPLALSQQFNGNGTPLAGALLYTYVTGTVAQPQTTYQDTGLSIPNAWPLVADANGRLPMFYLPAGGVHVRLTDSAGNIQYDNSNVLVLGGGGGGGGSSVDQTTLIATGDLKVRYGTGPISGFVRANGLTVSSAACGGTERANADTQNLYIYLYNADPNLAVSGGRTGNALNDFNSTTPCKPLTLPDWRGKNITALADMGNTATSVFTNTYAVCNNGVTTLGSACGNQSFTLAATNLPPYTPSGTVGTTTTTSTSTSIPNGSNTLIYGGASGAGGINILGGASAVNLVASSSSSSSSTSTFTGTAASGWNDTPFATLSPTMLATVYIKL